MLPNTSFILSLSSFSMYILTFSACYCPSFLHRSIKDPKMNYTKGNVSGGCIRDTSVTSVVFPCLYSILFVAALILNSMAAWIFFNIPSTSTFMVFLKNVVGHDDFCFINVVHPLRANTWIDMLYFQVVADLLMTLTIPVKILSDAGVGGWRLRVFYCRYSAVLFYITMYISILLLGLISLDRYLKIVRPFGKCGLQRVRNGQILSAAVWVVMLSLALPNVILSNKPPSLEDFNGGKVKCTSMKYNVGLNWHAGFTYFCQVPIW